MFALWRRAFICKNKIILEDIGHKFLLVSTKVDNLDLDGVSLCLCGQKYFFAPTAGFLHSISPDVPKV